MECLSSPSTDGSFLSPSMQKTMLSSVTQPGSIVIISSLVPDAKVLNSGSPLRYIQSCPPSNTLKTTKKIFRVSKLQNRYI